MYVFLVLLCVAFDAAISADLPVCKEGEFRYEFTECDSAGGRWRVAVPRKPEQCKVNGLESVRQNDCSSVCAPGQFLDVNSANQTCQLCPVGHYSLGGEVTFSNWTTFPDGFGTRSFDKSSSQYSRHKKGNCTKSGWTASGLNLASGIDACTSELTYAVTLKTDGSVTFFYQHTNDDIFFSVYVRNEQCMMRKGDKPFTYPTMTKNFEWKNITIDLKRGHNLIVWETSLYPNSEDNPNRHVSVVIKSIDVKGVAYTSQCTPCAAGTYSNTVGTRRCTPCLADYYSGEKATECKKCDTKTQYARPGSASCTEKKACTVNDYIEIHSVCDGQNKFKKMFQWIEPKICRDDITGSTSLPVSGQVMDCPPCNPGMFQNRSHCEFCPPMTFSDGTKTSCELCSASTEPEYGFDFHWWRSWPNNTMVICQSSYERGCASKDGFQLHGNYIDSGSGHADDAKAILFVEIDGFKRSILHPGLGSVTFEFEIVCEGPCSLAFHQVRGGANGPQYDTIKQWKGKQVRQKFVHQVSKEDIDGFYWIFEKDPNAKKKDNEDHLHFNHREDKVKIYEIKITHTNDGGAATCKDCPIGRKEEGCISCPEGNRIIKGKNGKSSCEPCPANTFLNASHPRGEEACVPCGPGLHSEKASTQCISSCHYTSSAGKSYNLTPFSGFHMVKTNALFTPLGTKYYHQFNISFCQVDPKVKASCMSNVTGESYWSSYAYNASVCRLTIIPRSGSDEPLVAQPMSVADQLVAIKTQLVTAQHEILGADENIHNSTVVSYHYHANDITDACPQGRSTVVYLACDHEHKEIRTSVPNKCSEGTCDGCRFHFILHSSSACVLCTENDYESVVTGCVGKMKSTTFVWKTPRLCEGGVLLPARNTTACSILERSVKDFVLVLEILAGFVILMILAVFVLWYKKRRLEYKYHKLIQNANDRSGEMPAAPQCIDDEDDDEDEEVHFKGSGRPKGFFKNLKNKFGGERVNLSEQYNFNNFSDDETIGSVEPSSNTPLH